MEASMEAMNGASMEAARSLLGSCFHKYGDSFRGSTRDFPWKLLLPPLTLPGSIFHGSSTQLPWKLLPLPPASMEVAEASVEGAEASMEAVGASMEDRLGGVKAAATIHKCWGDHLKE